MSQVRKPWTLANDEQFTCILNKRSQSFSQLPASLSAQLPTPALERAS